MIQAISRLNAKFLGFLSQGSTPRNLALSLALGMVVGLFPVLGLSTLLCTILALVFRLNLPAMQAANYGVYPLQLMLMLPFARLGEKVFHARAIPFSR